MKLCFEKDLPHPPTIELRVPANHCILIRRFNQLQSEFPVTRELDLGI